MTDEFRAALDSYERETPDHSDRDNSQPRCEECGEYMFFNHRMWSARGETHPNCEAAAKALRELPIRYDAAIQALVEIGGLLGRHICATDDDEYNDSARLLQVVHAAYAKSGEGISGRRGDEALGGVAA